jgi:thiamine-phosphate pyrophosphorylase
MFAYKKKYYLIIESIRDIDLSNIKLTQKFIIIYRNKNKKDNIEKLLKFRRYCKTKRIGFFISNDPSLMLALNADGIYISANNRKISFNRLRNSNYKIIGSAHNIKELNIKALQGCTHFIFSRLFNTNYIEKKGFMGIVRFNLLKLSRKENLIPLGGIRLSNLNKLSLVKSSSFAILSEVKKKPAKIFNRLF